MKKVMILFFVVVGVFISCRRFQVGVNQILYIYKSAGDYRENIWIDVYDKEEGVINRPTSAEIINPQKKHLKIYNDYYAFWAQGCNGCHNCISVPTSLLWQDSSALDTLTNEELISMITDDNPFLEYYSTNNDYEISCLIDSAKAAKIFKKHKLYKYAEDCFCSCLNSYYRDCDK